jgi:hypothetical protein
MKSLVRNMLLVGRKFFLAGIFLLFSVSSVIAQRVEAEAILTNNQIRIGEQVQLKLAVRYMEGSQKSVVTWPLLKDTITGKIEIIKADTIVTILANRASVLYEQSRLITITAFDSGSYTIPPQQFIVDKDTVQTDPLLFYVTSIPVDTTKPIKDIKGIYDVPAAPVIAEAGTNWWIWTIGALLILGAAFTVYYFTRKKDLEPEPVPVISRRILPHEKYLEQLAELGRKKPWMHGELKQYHIALTEILRSWLVERYRMHAKEMTTTEIIRILHSLRADSSSIMQLERVLRLADLVKFAKGIPHDEENENNINLAINFIQATAVYPTNQIPQFQ